MNRRRFLLGSLAGALTAPLPLGAQPATKLPRIGVLQPGSSATAQPIFEAFKQSLRERGYVEGQHVVFERRLGENLPERIAAAAAELVRIRVDVIVTISDLGVAAVKQQTHTIPIVMVSSTDPVGTGFVATLARPGGNITGLSSASSELSGKRVELLREVRPGLSRVAILWNPDMRGAVFDYKETERAARSLHLQLQSVEVTRADDFDHAFSELSAARAEALVVPSPNAVAFANRDVIVSLALRHRLLSVFALREFADAGGLISYGPNVVDQWRSAAVYVAKILKGAKPADLPVEQPTKFELVINLKTAKALGLAIPPSLLARADQVIE